MAGVKMNIYKPLLRNLAIAVSIIKIVTVHIRMATIFSYQSGFALFIKFIRQYLLHLERTQIFLCVLSLLKNQKLRFHEQLLTQSAVRLVCVQGA